MEGYSYDVDLLKPHLEKKTYCIRCRLCRKQLIVSDKIKFSHLGKAEPCGNCIFLDEEFLPGWIKDEIENSSWTKGRLKCPRADCTARVGGFDFIQGLLCGCEEFTIPAIWIQDGKVDVRAINSNDVMSTAKPSLTSSDKSCSRHISVSEESPTVTERVYNSNNANPSLTSSDKSHSRQIPVLKEEHSRHQFPCQGTGIGETSTNSAKTVEQLGYIDKMTQGSFCQAIGEAHTDTDTETNVLEQSDNVTDTIITEDISSSSLIQKSFHQVRGETYDGILQSIHHDNVNDTGIAEIRTGQLSTLVHPTTSMVRQRKNKTNRSEIAFTEQNIDKTRHITKPVGKKLGERTTSNRFGPLPNRFNPLPNRFNPLSVEEPAIVKPSDQTNPCTAMHEHLICAVCLDYFYKPYQCPCSHVFCESCLRQLYHNRAGNLKCPICRSSVKYIEVADQVREEIRQLQNPAIKQREVFEKTAKYRMWPLPPIGPLSFLRRRQTLWPKRDQNLVILATILLLVVCYTILYILP